LIYQNITETALASNSPTHHREGSADSKKKVVFAALRHRDFRYFFVTTMLAIWLATSNM
jgi:hypothetical protein